MTIHYHGTPITGGPTIVDDSGRRVPNAAFLSMAGRCFCVSFAAPGQIKLAHDIGQSVMHDNGRFTAWQKGEKICEDWRPYYRWVEPLIANAVHWAVIPDEIEADAEVQDALLKQWPFGDRGAPVWHLHEPLDRLYRLCDEHKRVCFGSSAEYAVVGADIWRERMDDAFNGLEQRHGRRLPWLHMLRGMQAVRWDYPFASVDSTDVGRNHHRKKSCVGAAMMAALWDSIQCPDTWATIDTGGAW